MPRYTAIPVRFPSLLLLFVSLTACSLVPAERQSPQPDIAEVPLELPPQQSLILDSLLAQKEDWQGVPYQYGGLSPQGVDCSGFVYLTFLSQLNMKVPRTTSALMQEGEPVARNELEVGDLVFFKTGPGNRHVGIYMGGDEFMHASVSSGVMQSSLNNPYWRQRYWKARRLVNR